MSQADSQNFSAHGYEDWNYEEVCVFGGAPPSHSNDTHLGKTRLIVHVQSVPSQPLSKKRKIHLDEGVGGKSTSSFDQPKSLKITLKKKSAPSSSDCHETNQLLLGPPSSDSSAAPVPSKSFEKRPIDEVETEVPGNTLATGHERARLAEEEPPHKSILQQPIAEIMETFNDETFGVPVWRQWL
nr:uncharacterized protein LOC109149872 [Ipomoea trifida]